MYYFSGMTHIQDGCRCRGEEPSKTLQPDYELPGADADDQQAQHQNYGSIFKNRCRPLYSYCPTGCCYKRR